MLLTIVHSEPDICKGITHIFLYLIICDTVLRQFSPFVHLTSFCIDLHITVSEFQSLLSKILHLCLFVHSHSKQNHNFFFFFPINQTNLISTPPRPASNNFHSPCHDLPPHYACYFLSCIFLYIPISPNFFSKTGTPFMSFSPSCSHPYSTIPYLHFFRLPFSVLSSHSLSFNPNDLCTQFLKSLLYSQYPIINNKKNIVLRGSEVWRKQMQDEHQLSE